MTRPGLLPQLFMGAALLFAPALYSQDVAARTVEIPRITESEQQLGTIAFGEQTFTVIAHSQTISPSPSARLATTVSSLEIRDVNAATVYRETFPASVVDGEFIQILTVSGSVLEGAGGRALVLRFLEDPASLDNGESWQVIGLVNNKLVRFGAPLPLGQGAVAVNGVLTGVMLSGGIGVVPLASTAEALEFRVWAGNFFLNVPVRIDWPNGQWSEAEQCYATEGGILHPVGCNLRVTAVQQPVPEGAAVTLYEQPQEDAYHARRVLVHPNSSLQFPAARALVKWRTTGDRFLCSFDDVWLQVNIDGNQGWVHSAMDFAALGMPSSGPAQ